MSEIRTDLGAFVITCDRPRVLHATLEAVAGQTVVPALILVVDNGDARTTREVLERVDLPAVEHVALGENLGPAGATAIGLERLAARGFEWLYWIDDDDPPQEARVLERLLALAALVDGEDLGGVGVVGSRFDWHRGELARLLDEELASGPHEVDVIAGNQQLVLARRTVERIGVADPRLFFGFYEPEYCLRIRRGGLRLVIDGSLAREHRDRWRRRGLGRRARRRPTPAYALPALWQRYYRTRNYIFMMRDTFGRRDLARREALKAAVRIPFAWLRGPRYGWAFTGLQLRGVADGYAGRMGRTVQPVPKYRPHDGD